MSVSSGSSTSVAPNSSVEYTSDDSEKIPTYVLGQRIPSSKRGDNADVVELSWADKFQPFVCVIRADDGTEKDYVGIVGELMMHDSNTVDHALMIIRPNKVVSVAPGDIYNIGCELLYPKGYGRKKNVQKNRVRFSKTKIMRQFWAGEEQAAEQQAAGAPGSASGN